MPSYIYKHLRCLICIFMVFLAGCAANKPSNIRDSDVQLDAANVVWSVPVSPEDGELLVNFLPELSSGLSIVLMPDEPPHNSILNIKLGDLECDVGYELRVAYQPRAREFLFKRFQFSQRWDQSQQVSVKWRGDAVEVTAGELQESFPVFDTPEKVAVYLQGGRVLLEDVAYRLDGSVK